MFSPVYAFSLYLQACRGLTPTLTGAAFTGINFSVLTSSITCGGAISRKGRYRWAIWTGWVVATIGIALMIVLDSVTPTYGWVLLVIPLGIGHGFLLISLNFGIQALAKERDGAYAAGLYVFARSFGSCLGVTLVGTILHNRLLQHVHDLRLPEIVAKGAEEYVVLLNSGNLDPAFEAMVRKAYGLAFRSVFEVLTGLSALAGLISLAIREENMDRKLESEHVVVGADSQLELNRLEKN
jgi:MFS family permease